MHMLFLSYHKMHKNASPQTGITKKTPRMCVRHTPEKHKKTDGTKMPSVL